MLAFPSFSGMAELVWDGKYDDHGNKRAPVRIELPFKPSSVNESAQDRQRTLELSATGADRPRRFRFVSAHALKGVPKRTLNSLSFRGPLGPRNLLF